MSPDNRNQKPQQFDPKSPDNLEFWKKMNKLARDMQKKPALKQRFENDPASVIRERGMNITVFIDQNGKQLKLAESFKGLDAETTKGVANYIYNQAMLPPGSQNLMVALGAVIFAAGAVLEILLGANEAAVATEAAVTPAIPEAVATPATAADHRAARPAVREVPAAMTEAETAVIPATPALPDGAAATTAAAIPAGKAVPSFPITRPVPASIPTVQAVPAGKSEAPARPSEAPALRFRVPPKYAVPAHPSEAPAKYAAPAHRFAVPAATWPRVQVRRKSEAPASA